jgi:hypothetical protein
MPAPIVPVATAAVARLVAKHGAKQVQRALNAANKPAKGKKASQARGRGASYQSKVDENVMRNRPSRVPDKMARDATKLRRDISKYNKDNKGRGRGR